MDSNKQEAIGSTIAFSIIQMLSMAIPGELIPYMFFKAGFDSVLILISIVCVYGIVVNVSKFYFSELVFVRFCPRKVRSLYLKNHRTTFTNKGAFWKLFGSLYKIFKKSYNFFIFITCGLILADKKLKRVIGHTLLFVYGALPFVTTVGILISALNKSKLGCFWVVIGDILRLLFFVKTTIMILT